jgi:pyruvate dehydrogenase E1 component alpha subunit
MEEDYIFPSLGFAATHQLPILFVCEDNDLAILTKKDARRNWDAIEVAEAFGIQGLDVEDDPIDLISILNDIRLPFFLNIHTERHRYHVGVGKDNEPKQDRLKELGDIFPDSFFIGKEIREYIYKLWH